MMNKTYILIIVAVLISAISIFYITKNKSNNLTEVAQTQNPTSSVAPTNTMQNEELTQKQKELEEKFTKLMAQDKIAVKIKTNAGEVSIDLYPKVAPKTVANFLALSLQGFYDGLKFHRVVAGFVAQGGDPLSRTDDPRVGSGGPGYQFEDEINARALGLDANMIKTYESRGYKYTDGLASIPVKVGTLAMANSGPNTNGSQFFIVTDMDQPHLNGLHTVFGEVKSDMNIVRKIKQGDTMQIVVE